MTVVILDGYTTNPGDLSWDSISQLAPCTVWDRTAPADVIPRLGDAEIALTNKTLLGVHTVAAVGRAFGMSILVNRRSAQGPIPEGGEFVDLDRLFQESDVVSLHCPLTPQTAELVDATRLAQMKPTAYLINTARGPLVQESHLLDALQAGRLAGAGLDVLSVEPPAPDHPLLRAPKCVITPHIARATRTARHRLIA
ncbi:NAD(P)-dependent oxidoreductase [Vulcanococcus sp.]|uniref:NAD(P)-dependent oxidoreductase n=1 Tax=Vulcanococcus sp. TaxID=2856995 RepID=UPI003F6957C4